MERLVLGALVLAVSVAWFFWRARRASERVSPGQAWFDFATGAPRESVLNVGLFLLGLLLVAAHFFGGR